MKKLFRKNKSASGLTLVETLIAVGIFIAISFLISSFIRSIFFMNADLSNSLSAQFDVRVSMKRVISELRSTSPSSLGAYPISAAATSSITFYSDVDNDGLKDKIRYFLQNKDLKRGIVKPSGTPLTYNDAGETVTTLATSVSNATGTPIFEYFDENYAGSGNPLTYPLTISAIRLVRVTLVIEKDSNRLPVPFTISTQVSLRNLKDNL